MFQLNRQVANQKANIPQVMRVEAGVVVARQINQLTKRVYAGNDSLPLIVCMRARGFGDLSLLRSERCKVGHAGHRSMRTSGPSCTTRNRKIHSSR